MSNMKEKWVVRSKKADFHTMMKKHGIGEVIARILVNRDIVEERDINLYLKAELENLNDPAKMKDIDKACNLLQKKIDSKEKIRIVGDYDVDGICATYILYTGLLHCGAFVDYEIPDRIKDGYGINSNIIKEAHKDGIDTILTCDNGIAAIEQVKMGKEFGMTVIITDHHDIPYIEEEEGQIEQLPDADAIINPKQSDCGYPYKMLCGAAVAFKLIQSLYEIYKINIERIYPLLEVVAIATVCDVMDLIGENRVLVKYGLELLKETNNLGLKTLIDLSNIQKDNLSAYHLGFIIGPCLNASGRLDTAKKGIRLLLSESKEEADLLAKELKELNDTRKDMTMEGLEQAITIIEDKKSTLQSDKVIVVYLPECHESIAGIIAGRIREKYNKPAIVLTKSENGVKGSGRSIECYNMHEELTKCSHLLLKFGGHPMAAGLSLEEDNVKPLRTLLNENTALTEEDIIPKISIDIVLPLGYITQELVEELTILEPFGKGNPKPVFAERNLKVLRGFILGKNKNVCKLNVVNEYGRRMDAMYFGDIPSFMQNLTERFGEEEVDKMFQNRENKITLSVTYYPNINEYNGNRNIQIVILNYLI